MSLPKEPRQKMINIMYLVLTALLALNVSNEILNAFKTIDQSLTNANVIIQKKNEDVLKSLQKKLADPKTAEKATIWAPKADKAHALADGLFNYIQSLKQDLKVESRLKIVDGKEKFNEDDLEASTRLFIKKDDQLGMSKGQDLLKKLAQFKKDLAILDPSIEKEVIPSLPLDLNVPKSYSKNNDTSKKNWDYSYFHMTPTIASLTILTKFQNDIRNSESQVVDFCHRQIGEVEVIYDQFNAFAATNSQYLMSGDDLVITAGVGAFSSAAKPTVSIDGAVVPITADGSAIFKTTAGAAGENSKRVRISFFKPSGETAVVEKIIKYTVGTPAGLVVSTDKTRVFYKGLPNPLSITGGGGAEKINATVEGNNATITKTGPGQYIVNCTQLGTVVLNINDGKQNQKIAIPIRRVPSPLAEVGEKPSGNMPAEIFRKQGGVIAELKDFVFEGIKFPVVSFVIMATGKGFDDPEYVEVGSNKFAPQATSLIKRCQAGTTVIIASITVLEPGGGTRKLDQTLTYILQ